MLTNRLKEILQERGQKQKWLAEKCSIKQSTLSNIINNNYQPAIETAFKIADILQTDINNIFKYTRD